jgi:Secretion system C-terminal sorting domain
MAHQLKLLLLMLLFYTAASSQQISPQTINTAGRSSSNGGVVLEDAVGGLAVSSISTPTFMYTQDFLQPNAGTTTILPPINDVVLSSGSGIDNAGTTFIAGNAIIDFTVGEAASITLSNGSNMLTQGILQPLANTGSLPITGLEFYAKRVSNNQVQLDWKTLNEINNKGFYIERKKDNESLFTNIGFANSKGSGGNSSTALQYQQYDNNSFAGNSYYRLKQEDFDGKISYSVVRLVKGEASKQLTMKVWPVPAISYFNVFVTGIDKADAIQLFDVGGRMIKSYTIQNQTQLQVSGLPAGTYFVKLASDNSVVQKVIVQ